MKLKVEKEKCIGCGICVSSCPEVYAFDDNGLAYVSTDTVEDDSRGSAVDALENCPTDAILKVE